MHVGIGRIITSFRERVRGGKKEEKHYSITDIERKGELETT